MKKIKVQWKVGKKSFEESTGPTPHRLALEFAEENAKYDPNYGDKVLPKSQAKAMWAAFGLGWPYGEYALDQKITLTYIRKWLQNSSTM